MDYSVCKLQVVSYVLASLTVDGIDEHDYIDYRNNGLVLNLGVQTHWD